MLIKRPRTRPADDEFANLKRCPFVCACGGAEFEAQGTLRVRDSFKGCIRNVVIRGEIKDWTDMARLNNVLLNACPIH